MQMKSIGLCELAWVRVEDDTVIETHEVPASVWGHDDVLGFVVQEAVVFEAPEPGVYRAELRHRGEAVAWLAEYVLCTGEMVVVCDPPNRVAPP